MKASNKKLLRTLTRLVVPIAFCTLIFCFYIMGCDSVQQTDYKGSIQGWVYDDSSKIPLYGVLITSTQFPQSIYTNDSGMFYLKDLSLSTSEQNFNLKLELGRYQNLNIRLRCKSDEVSKYDSIYMKKDTLK